MTRPLRIDDDALSELHAAALWLEDRAGLGESLVVDAQAAFTRIAEAPAAGAPLCETRSGLTARGVRLRRFSCRVVFVESSDAIHVLAFAHVSRDPDDWRSRLPP